MSKKTQKWVPTDRATFEAMDVVGKRKAIAGDVLAGIAAGTLVGSRLCTVLSLNARTEEQLMGEDLDTELREAKRCYVCGIGGALVAAGRVVDELSSHFGLSIDGEDMGPTLNYLAQWFPRPVLHLIDCAYEGRAVDWYVRFPRRRS